jgi:hypothetical protein
MALVKSFAIEDADRDAKLSTLMPHTMVDIQINGIELIVDLDYTINNSFIT